MHRPQRSLNMADVAIASLTYVIPPRQTGPPNDPDNLRAAKRTDRFIPMLDLRPVIPIQAPSLTRARNHTQLKAPHPVDADPAATLIQDMGIDHRRQGPGSFECRISRPASAWRRNAEGPPRPGGIGNRIETDQHPKRPLTSSRPPEPPETPTHTSAPLR